MDSFKLTDYSALTVGLVPFTLLLFLIDISTDFKLSHILALYPSAPLKFDLNALSFYPFLHKNIIHWVLNITSLGYLLNNFEKNHGTIYTGITLNLLTVIAGLQYCLLGSFLFQNTHVMGLSGLVFSFMTFYAVKESEFKPILYQFKVNTTEIIIPTKYSPFIWLFVIALIIPGSSFFGHLTGITTGYLLVYKKINFLYPSSKIILFIEKKVAFLIVFLKKIVNFVTEEDGVNLRTVNYVPFLSTDLEINTESNFRGQGHVVGTE